MILLAFAQGHVLSDALLLVAIAVGVIVLAQSTVHGIYAAALYRYAIGDGSVGGVSPGALQSAFVAKT
ncbi:MAG: hypothetical protein ABI440_03215 [Casimicrobiaceae bacterium]